MAETKMTRKEMFALIAETMNDNAEIVEFCEKQIEALSKPRKKAVNKEAAEFRAAVATWMAENPEPVTAAALGEALGVSFQKAGAALRALVAEDAAIRVEGEGKNPATFVLA